MEEVLFEIGIIIIASTLLALLGRFFKQPSIIAYIFAGIVIGPIGLKLIHNSEIIGLFSELGIVFLLFIVGMELDLRKLKGVGKSAGLVGVGQMLFTTLIGFSIAFFIFEPLQAAYLAVALAFSSTVIVVKLLSDRKEIDTLHGRIALGVLIVQDIFAMFAMVIFANIGSFSVASLIIAMLKIAFLFFMAYGTYMFVGPRLLKVVAKNSEHLFLAAISICFTMAGVAYLLGLSMATGAFLAGLTLAASPYTIEMVGRIKSLRDFFVVMFFVTLGLQITIEPLVQYLIPIIALSAFVVIGNPLILSLLMRLMKFTRRTSFLTSISLAQISEFSLIFVSLGYTMGHLTQEILSITAIIATITIAISTYFISYDNQMYKFMKKNIFRGREHREKDLEYIPKKEYNTILIGHNRIGYTLLNKLLALKKDVLVIDYNPDTIRELIERKIPCLYGDLGDLDVIEYMKLKKAKLVISTVSNLSDNLLLIDQYKRKNHGGKIIVAALHPDEALELYEAGADYVIVPHLVGAEHASFIIDRHHKDLKSLLAKKREHIKTLKMRQKQRSH